MIIKKCPSLMRELIPELPVLKSNLDVHQFIILVHTLFLSQIILLLSIPNKFLPSYCVVNSSQHKIINIISMV